jgi:hypothetical protein
MAKQNVLDDDTAGSDFPAHTPRTPRAGRNTRTSKARKKKPARAKSSVPEVTAPAIRAETKKFSQTVWIGCKLPRGLVIQCCEEVVLDKPTFGGGVKPTRMFMRTGEQVRLKGYAVPFGKVPNYPIIGDFGLTEVKRDFWERWISQNSKLELVTKGLIFVHGEKASVEAYAQEHADLKCGLEPLNPHGDPRVDKVESDNLSDIEPDMERSKSRKTG